MASVVITIDTDGAAFHDGPDDSTPLTWEVARILRVVAGGIENYGLSAHCEPRDSNGNVCGKVEIID